MTKDKIIKVLKKKFTVYDLPENDKLFESIASELQESGESVPEISDEEIEQYLTMKKPYQIDGEAETFFYFGDVANEAIKRFMRFYKSELSRRMNNEVTTYDLKEIDRAEEERNDPR